MNAAAVSTTPPDVLESSQLGLERFHWLLGREAPGAERREWARATAIRNGMSGSGTNALFVRPGATDLDRVFGEAREFLRRSPIWKLTCPADMRDAVAPLAARAGLEDGPSTPRMILDSLPPPAHSPDGVTIRVVADYDSLLDFLDTAVRAFEIPRWALRAAFAYHRWTTEPGGSSITWLVGYEGKRPVAVSAQVTERSVTGIAFVGTVPEARRRGLGRAMTLAAIAEGQRLGATAAWLQATPMGRPLYERMGFRWVCDDLSWIYPPRGFGRLRRAARRLSIAIRSPGPRPPAHSPFEPPDGVAPRTKSP